VLGLLYTERTYNGKCFLIYPGFSGP